MKKELIDKIYKQGELAFIWEAYKKTSSIISQFEQVNEKEVKENMFTDIDKNPSDYKKFELINIENPEIKFSVDLETGDFNLNNVIIKNNIDITNQQLKCIFWRRKAITMNLASVKESFKYLHYIIGWQTNIGGTSVKKEYKIFPDFSVQEVLHKQGRKLVAKANILKK